MISSKVLVIIPAFNEGEKIVAVVADVCQLGYDVIVVDDGSSDQTADLASGAKIKVLRHIINRGQGAALRTGIAYAKSHQYQTVVLFDADGQMIAREIATLIKPLKSGDCEVVLGSRFRGQAKNIPLTKLVTLKIALLFTRLTTGLKLSDVHNGFQAWRVEVFDRINLIQDRQAYASELLQEISRKKIKYQEVPVTIKYTSYSKNKGQSIFNAFNIVIDLIFKK